MSAREVLARLPRRVRVWAEGDGLHYQAPKGTMTPDLRGTIQRHKPGLLHLLVRAEGLLGMTLTQFEDARCCLEVQVPGLRETLWFVPGLREAGSLQAGGIPRGRIWTAAELRDLMAAPGMTQDDAIAIARTKIAFGAEIVEAGPAGQAPEPLTDGPPEPEQTSLDLGLPEREFD